MKMTVENALLYLRGLCLAKPKLLGVAVGDCCTPYFVLYHRTCARYLTWYDVAVQRVRTPKRTNERREGVGLLVSALSSDSTSSISKLLYSEFTISSFGIVGTKGVGEWKRLR